MAGALARLVYATALRLLTPVYLARLWGRGRTEPRYRRHIGQRLGLYHGGPPPPADTLWVHAVSLGETRAAASLVDTLRARRPGVRLLLTCSTATGWEAGKHLLQPGDLHAWLPYDTPGAVRRFLRRFRPSMAVLMETEIWPVLMHECARVRLPVVLANARLSERSQRKGERWSALMRPAAAALTQVLAQTAADAQRLGDAGAPRVMVCGNLKFDMSPSPRLLAKGVEWRQHLHRPVVLAASTREGEEGPLLQAWATLSQPRPLLLLVPRHPQRFDEVATLAAALRFTVRRRSSWGERPPDDATAADVWVGDSMGEMPLYYACADVALLGGSFAPLGGQNLIEAAACGCPVVMGPHTFNFDEAARLSLDARAALRVKDVEEGVEQAMSLARDTRRNAWVERAFAFAAAHRGATERTAQQILGLWPRATR